MSGGAMKKAFVTFGMGTYAALLDIARPSFKAFCSRHGYSYFEAGKIGHQRPAPWYKVQCLQTLLQSFDMVVFSGADLVIVDGREDFPLDTNPQALPWIQAMVTHHTQCGDVPNDDLWICKREMIPWLDKVWALDKYLNHGWWEQAALMDLMGYDPTIENFPTHCKDITNELYQHTLWLPNEWNVHCWDQPQPLHPRIQHATMWADRVGVMQTWAKQAEEWINEPVYQSAY
jgi:hypothetical protein